MLSGWYLQIILHELVDLHYGGLVSTPVAVVGGGEDGDDVAVVRPVVPAHDQLMGTGDSSQPIRVVKLLRDVLTEAITGTSRGDTPTTSVIGVGPEEIADGALVGSFLDAVKLADLVKSVDTGGQTTMEAEDLVLNHSRKG